ncbi:hypothetical protein NQ315_016533 [Exocentrus adspersus]|uniref:Cytochrome b-c1 complex subunit 8 n=1 Tax=Exocentrus adspersus TaxID=1586481 RepID=A0AAV8VYW7_9CUCU|nr:hypothetical protein NQ315_016533 [Exocentrus adspersus]
MPPSTATTLEDEEVDEVTFCEQKNKTTKTNSTNSRTVLILKFQVSKLKAKQNQSTFTMGHGFGQLYKLRGIITYRLSPFEQRAFAGVISKGIPNTLRRISESIFYVVPPLAIGYLVYDQAEKEHERLMRKNPADYENDK